MKSATHIWLPFAALVLFFASCQKEENKKSELSEKSDQFKGYVQNKAFVAVDFYSDKPVDYIKDDQEVRAETDLRKYMYTYIKDDRILFDANGVLRINQNSLKIPGNDSAVLVRSWEIRPGTQTVNVNFVDYDYRQRLYHLVEYNDTTFLAYVDYDGGAKLYSRFSKR